MVWNLGRGIDDEPLALHLCKAYMRLKRRMLDLACLIRAFHNGIGLLEGLLHIAYVPLVGCSHVVPYVSAKWELVDDLAFAGVLCGLVIFIKVSRCAGSVFDYAVMYRRGPWRHRLLYSEDRRKHFVLNLYELARSLRLLQGLGYDCSHPVSNVPYLEVEEPSVVWGWLRIALARLHVMGVRRIVCGEDGDDTLHLLSLACIYGLYVCTCMWASKDDHVAGIGWNVVLNEGLVAGYELGSVYLGHWLSNVLAFRSERRGYGCRVFAVLHLLLCKLDCKIVVLIACIPYEDA